MLGRIEFTLEGRPVPWARTGHGAGARVGGVPTRFTPKAQRHAATAVKAAYLSAARREGRNAPLTGALKLEVLCVYDVPASWKAAKREAALRGYVWKTSVPDCDNLGKLVGDALNGIAYSDDALIAVSTVAKRYGAPERTVIRLTELEAWDEAFAASGLPGSQPGLAL